MVQKDYKSTLRLVPNHTSISVSGKKISYLEFALHFHHRSFRGVTIYYIRYSTNESHGL
jgi:hypothetical protein